MHSKVQAQLIKGMLWIHFNGRTVSVDATPGRKSRKKGAGGSSDQIAAPMPGKVTKILLKEGAAVMPGQPVLVMEAMKMEYTLKAEIGGEIEAVHCTVGDQVVLGKILVKIKPG